MQSKMTTFKSTEFVVEDRIVQNEVEPLLATEIPPIEVLLGIDSTSFDVPECAFLSVPPTTFKFTPGIPKECDIGFLIEVHCIGDGNERSTMQNDKIF